VGVSKRTQMDETIWFALDKGQVIKVVRNQTYDTLTNPNIKNSNGKNGAGGGGGNFGNGGAGKNGGGGGGGSISFDVPPGSTNIAFQGKGGRRGGFGGLGGGGDTPPGQGGGFQNRGGQGGLNQPQAPKATLVRLSVQQIFILEQ
jgi:hypothetical protein